jgi:hypothetical protein
MFMITKLLGTNYKRIPGTPLIKDMTEASVYAARYQREHPSEFHKGLGTIQVRTAPKSEF